MSAAQDPRSAYAGLATRTLAFAADALVINAVAWFVGAVAALALSMFSLPETVKPLFAAIAAGAALLWTLTYFVFFWSGTGQTPGSRLLGITVRDAGTAGPLRARRAALRLIALPLSVIPLGAGLLMILVDPRRRALHDRIARSVVVYVPIASRRLRAAEAREARETLVQA